MTPWLRGLLDLRTVVSNLISRSRVAVVTCCLAIVWISPLTIRPEAQEDAAAAMVRARYDKREVHIPMRDGVRLFTIIYTPKDQRETYPFLMTRTGYGIPPYGPDTYRAVLGPNSAYANEGYIFVYQDTRGRFRSEGTFIHHQPHVKGVPGESTDTYDTIEWLLKNVPNHNGRVGQWGISLAGWHASMGMIDAHPALKASSPQAPPQDQFLGDDYHSGGAFQLAYAFAWMSSNARARKVASDAPAARFDYGMPDGYRFFLELGAAANARKFFQDDVPTWNDYMKHGTYDEYWQSRHVPKDLDNIGFPVLVVGGWFDAEDHYGPFMMYKALEEKNPTNRNKLVVGPWSHGQWARGDGASLGPISFGSNTSEHFRTQIELPFFNFYLKAKGTFDVADVVAFETGANRWRSHTEWPPAGTKDANLYLHPNGRLSFDAPTGVADAFDSYVSDPQKPVPHTSDITTREGSTFVVEDQRFASRRPDVLVYESEVLSEDVTIVGPIEAHLNVATTGTDGDWVVKIIDVFPGDTPDPTPNPQNVRMGGYEMLVAGDILRAKFRKSFSKPEPMVPGEITPLQFPLGERYHTFRRGHRIMVHVQSSWFPMFDRNPQTFVDVYHAKPSDYQKATQRIYRSRERPSSVRVRLMSR
jgi:putative CocE/NonD family hydrolase